MNLSTELRDCRGRIAFFLFFGPLVEENQPTEANFLRFQTRSKILEKRHEKSSLKFLVQSITRNTDFDADRTKEL